MKLMYVADDGMQFDSEWDCMLHEHECFMRTVAIKAIDSDGRQIADLSADDDFNRVQKIYIETRDELNQIRRIDQWCGFYGEIDAIGVWKWDDDKQSWVIVERR